MSCITKFSEISLSQIITNTVFTIAFTFIVIFGTCGNAVVLWIVIGKINIVVFVNDFRKIRFINFQIIIFP